MDRCNFACQFQWTPCDRVKTFPSPWKVVGDKLLLVTRLLWKFSLGDYSFPLGWDQLIFITSGKIGLGYGLGVWEGHLLGFLWLRLSKKWPINIGPRLVLSSIFFQHFLQYFYLEFLAPLYNSVLKLCSKVQVKILKM